MRLQHLFAALGTGALLALAACSNGEVDAASSEANAQETTAPAAQPVADLAPDLSLVEARSAEKWNHAVGADWLQVYDYLLPAMRADVSIGTFMSNKEHHEYRNPSKPRLIGDEGNLAFVELSVLWTPHHPILQTAKNAPKDLTDELHMVETWAWEDGTWYFVKNERVREFFEAHPQLAKKGKVDDESQGDGEESSPK